MNSHVQMGFGVAGTFASHPTVFIAMLKYVFFSGWDYPFYCVIFLNGVLFLASVAYFIYKLRYYQQVTSSFFIFNALDLIKVNFLFCGEWLLCAYSLYQEEMSVARYIMIASPFDFLFYGLQSTSRMHRPMNPAHWIAMTLCFIGYGIFDILNYNGETEINWSIHYTAGWKGPLCCIFSRACRTFMTIQTKKMLMKKGFSEKYYIKKEMEQRRRTLNPDDLDEDGFLRPIIVSYDSVVYKKSLQMKGNNEIRKENDYMELKKQTEEEAEAIEEQKKVLREKFKKELIQHRRDDPGRKKRLLENEEVEIARKNLKTPGLSQEKEVPLEKDDDDMLIENRVNEELKQRITAHAIAMQDKKRLYEEMTQNQKARNGELETMLVDYEELPFFLHFFSGMEEIRLSKIDDIIDNPLYDNEIVGYTWETSFELYGIAGGIALFPVSCLCSFFTGEVPEAYEQMVGSRIDGPFGDGYFPLIVACFFSILFAVRGPSLCKFLFAINRSLYYSLHIFTHFFVLFYSVIFVDQSATLHATFAPGVMCVVVSYMVFYIVCDFVYSYKESNSNIDLIKMTMDQNSGSEQFGVLEVRFLEIARILGYDTVYRIMVDMAVTKNINSLLYTASPTIPTRVLFDREYFYRYPLFPCQLSSRQV